MCKMKDITHENNSFFYENTGNFTKIILWPSEIDILFFYYNRKI
ncbi:MAG: hypothetical protein K0R00_413 [Herbinix sp.]|nr:hypothetical protein [Herbinix sp.]